MKLKNLLLCMGIFLAGLYGIACPLREMRAQSSGPIVMTGAAAPELRSSQDSGERALFRASLQFVDATAGKPANIAFPQSVEDLRQAITIREGGREYHPFFVFPPETKSLNKGNRDVLILFDVSGSMAKSDIPPSRIEAAKGAARSLLGTLSPGDLVAIAPFDNREVRARIDAAAFMPASPSLVDAIPAPGGDTALYSATSFALQKLSGRKEQDASREPILIILTDGRNDVGGVAGLMTEAQFPTLLTEIKNNNIQIFTIGFGTPDQDFDAEVLRKMSFPPGKGRYFPASDRSALVEALKDVRELSGQQIKFAFDSGYSNYQNLKSLRFDVEYRPPGGESVRGQIQWDCGPAAGCAPKGPLANEERKAWIETGTVTVERGHWSKILTLFAKLALFSGGLAVLWLFLPRLVWPGPAMPSGFWSMRGQDKSLPSKKSSSTLPSRRSNQNVPPPAPLKPRQRFEETRIYDERSAPSGVRRDEGR